jgi:RimJ/RimL family protein N-acetyltransferase
MESIKKNSPITKIVNTITFNLLQNIDLPLLFTWFMQPYIATWWQEPTTQELFNQKWTTRIITQLTEENNPFNGYIIILNGLPIGYIQYYTVTAKDRIGYPSLPKHTVGLDLFIGDPAFLGKKLSTPIITIFINTIITIREPTTTLLIIDPAPTNQRAIHVYEKAGFKKLGIFKRPYGQVHLMFKHII